MNWFKGGVGEAIAEAKIKGSVFVVFVKGESDDEPSNALETILDETEVSDKLANMVCIEVVNGSPTCSQFAAIYPVILVPSMFFIDSKTGVDLEITGGVITKDQLVTSIEKAVNRMEDANDSSKDTSSPSATGAESSKISTNEESNKQREVNIEHSSTEPTQSSTENSTSEVVPQSSSKTDNISLEERVERARRLAQQKQLEREQEAKEKDKNAELERRNIGKDMSDMKGKREEQELKEAAMNRKKDKEEEKKAREAVKAAIEQDRLARKIKYDSEKKVVDEKKKEIEKENLIKLAAAAEVSAAERASIARIQFRLPDGRSQTHQFPADSPLSEVYSYVEKELVGSSSQVSLSTTFPRRHLDNEDKTKSLKVLQMAPSATILVIPAGGLMSGSPDGSLMSLLWLILTPFTFIWAMLTNLFSGSSNNLQPTSQSTTRIGRIRNAQDEEDDNNTWNGNSTQQQ